METNTELYLAAQGGGFTQVLLRQQQQLKALLDAEVLAASTSVRQQRHLESVLLSLSGIETALANNTRQALQVQLLILKAAGASANERVTQLTKVLDQLR